MPASRPVTHRRPVALLAAAIMVALSGACGNGLVVSASNRAAQANVNYVLANLLEAADHQSSFAGVSVTGLAAAKQLVLTTGPAERIASSSSQTKTSAISVDLCADGRSCRAVVVAARGTSENCWYARMVLTAENGVARLAYAERSNATRCEADDVPTSGWASRFPSKPI
jgi:hypothetical protein